MELAGIGVVVLAFVAYFLPALIANSRKNPSTNSITLVNLFLGWTVLGWLAALIWALAPPPAPRNDEAGPSPETHVKCPDCAELVRRDARVCKHCGCRLAPQET